MPNYNKKIWDIWKNFEDITKPLNRAPLIYPELTSGGFLCIGMNPSFSKGDNLIETQAYSFEGLSRDEFYSLEIAEKYGVEWAKEELSQQSESFKNHAYFKNFRLIKSQILDPKGIKFQHVDLFPFRETSQNEMLCYVQHKKTSPKNHPNFNEIGLALFDAFIEMLEFISPDYIMVNNAEVSHMLLSHFGLDYEKDLDQVRGCYYFNIVGESVPVFCSGMLSGQRALDIYSRERLFWHLTSFIETDK